MNPCRGFAIVLAAFGRSELFASVSAPNPEEKNFFIQLKCGDKHEHPLPRGRAQRGGRGGGADHRCSARIAEWTTAAPPESDMS